MNKKISTYIQYQLSKIDWKLLLFLLLVVNVKLYVKLAGVIIIFILRPGFTRLFRLKRLQIPLFYPVIIVFSLLQLLARPSHLNADYLPIFLAGAGFWFISFLILIQIRFAIEVNEPEKLHRTITVFFLINALFSICTLLFIMAETGSLNPYSYQGLNQKYFIGTGDYIRGISFDSATTNSIINASGVIYFLVRKKNIWAVICMLCLLLCGSNFINAVMAVLLIGILVFYRNKLLKSMAVVCMAIMVCFVVRIFPSNHNYMTNYVYHQFYKLSRQGITTETTPGVVSKEDRKLVLAQRYLDSIATIELWEKRKNDPTANLTKADSSFVVRKADIHSAPYQRNRDTPLSRKMLIHETYLLYGDSSIFGELPEYKRWPGKLIAYRQTLGLLRSDLRYLFFGAGPGNFSSRLAFKASGINTFAGSFPKKFAHIDTLFKYNHLRTYLYYRTKDEEKHSLLNFPNSVYNQLAAEYGLPGIILFLVFYIGFFFRHYRKLSYGIPLLIFFLVVFAADYWFENLSIVILFELLMLLDLHTAGSISKKETR